MEKAEKGDLLQQDTDIKRKLKDKKDEKSTE